MKPTPMFMLTVKSKNRKVGKIAVSTSPMSTCPSSCQFKNNGCYALSGPLRCWWNRCSANTNDMVTEWENFLFRVVSLPEGTVFRHNQAGDLSGHVEHDGQIDGFRLNQLVTNCKLKNLSGYTYTHYPVLAEDVPAATKTYSLSYTAFMNRGVIEKANCKNFVINLSANGPAHVDDLIDSGIKAPICTLLHSTVANRKEHSVKTPRGRKIVLCPAMWNKEMTCDKCRACMNPDRKAVIGFISHGHGIKKCNAIVEKYMPLRSK